MVYVVLQFYGWWQWICGGQDYDGCLVSCLNVVQCFYGFGVGLVGSVVFGYLMVNYIDVVSFWWDVGLIVFSLVV